MDSYVERLTDAGTRIIELRTTISVGREECYAGGTRGIECLNGYAKRRCDSNAAYYREDHGLVSKRRRPKVAREKSDASGQWAL